MKCKYCNKDFNQSRKNKVFCSRSCKYSYRNDRKPRISNKSYKRANHLKSLPIPPLQKEVILGTLMGDGCLYQQTSFHRLSLCHCEKQFDYIEWKRKILSSVFTTNHCSQYKKQYHCHSISHPQLTEIYGQLYLLKKKHISRKYLNQLTPTSLLFWYLDDGSVMKSSSNAIVFCTDSFSLSENKAVQKWLWQKFRIDSKLMQVKGSFLPDKTYWRIRLNKENSQDFIRLLSSSPLFESVPECMRYKTDIL